MRRLVKSRVQCLIYQIFLLNWQLSYYLHARRSPPEYFNSFPSMWPTLPCRNFFLSGSWIAQWLVSRKVLPVKNVHMMLNLEVIYILARDILIQSIYYPVKIYLLWIYMQYSFKIILLWQKNNLRLYIKITYTIRKT